MEFNDLDELKEYMKQRALERTKFKLKLSRHKKYDTSNETLNDIFKASLKEIKNEILDGFKNGTIVVHKKTKIKHL